MYLCEYFNSAMAPEAQVESSFSVLKVMLLKNSRLALLDINYRFRIMQYFRNMYSEKSKVMMQQCADEMEKRYRSPYVDLKRSQFKHSEVVDKLLFEEKRDYGNDNDYTYDNYYYDEEVESDDGVLEQNEFDDIALADMQPIYQLNQRNK